MKIVTGYQGKAHITSNDDQGRNQGIFGTDSYVTSVGQQFAATLVNANELDIADGEGVMQGVHFRIEPGEVDAAKLQNGTSGMKRIDLVVARYTKDSSTGIENVALVVIKGTESSSTPAVPAYNSGEILKGKNTVDFPLYKVTYNGINVSSVDRMFTKLQTMAELQTAVNKLNTDLTRGYSAYMDWPTITVNSASWMNNAGGNGVGVKPDRNSTSGYNLALNVPGRYLIFCIARFNDGSNTSGIRGIRLIVDENSVQEDFIAPPTNNTTIQTMGMVYSKTGMDYVRMGFYQSSGSALEVRGIHLYAIYLGNW